MASRERVFFDGWELTEGTVRDWESYEGMDGVSAYAGVNATVPGMPGEVWTPKRLGPGSFTLSVWLYGRTRVETNAAWRTLLRATRRPHRQIVVRRVLPDGEAMFARAELSGAIQPTFTGDQGMRASLTFAVASGVWESEVNYYYQTNAGSALTQNLPLPELAASTAVMDKGYFTINGPITNPRLVDRTDGVDGAWLQYTGAIPAGQALAVDAGLFILRGNGGFNANPGAISYSGPHFFSIPAPPPGAGPVIQLRGSGGGSGTRLEVECHRAYGC